MDVFRKQSPNAFLYASKLLVGTYTGMDLLTFLKTFSPNSGGVIPSKIIEVIFEQPSKASSPISVTELGIMIDLRPEQLQKAHSPILVTELGIVIEVRPKQSEKASCPISVTELGIAIEVRCGQSWKTCSPILFTELGITVFMHPKIKVLDSVSMIALL